MTFSEDDAVIIRDVIYDATGVSRDTDYIRYVILPVLPDSILILAGIRGWSDPSVSEMIHKLLKEMSECTTDKKLTGLRMALGVE